jgi:uncharacterized protein (DUF2384 family)
VSYSSRRPNATNRFTSEDGHRLAREIRFYVSQS